MAAEKPMVSVYCLTYNHENYIRDCLEGFVAQKTAFPFEVIVHDDASTDRTAEIVQEYEKKYPHIFKVIYEEENQYQRHRPILRDLVLPIVRGKYIAICEGDDYWIDDQKLQDQVTILENNPDCHFCVAGVEEVALDKTPLGVFHPAHKIESLFISPKAFVAYANDYSFQTSSYMMRYDDWKEYIQNPPEFRKKSDIGDLPILLNFGSLGRTAYIDRIVSCYRRGALTSYSAKRIFWSEEERITHWTKSVESWKAFDVFSNGRFKDTCSNAIAKPMFDICIVTCNAKQFFMRENIRYFQALPSRKKLFILLATVLKKPIRTLYWGKVKKTEKSLLKSWN